MKKLFPDMINRPGTGHVIGIFSYWFLAFVLFPFMMPVLAYGLWRNVFVVSWIEIIYHIENAFMMALVLREHLSECALNLQIEAKDTVQTVLAAVVMMASYVMILVLVLFAIHVNPYFLVNVFPITEMNVSVSPGVLVTGNPVFGIACLSVFTPFALCGLFYTTGFAPVACNKPWLAYITVSFVLLLPVLFDIFWRDEATFRLLAYVLALPVHLIACWSYQKTDSAWTPIISLAVFNLITAVANLIIL